MKGAIVLLTIFSLILHGIYFLGPTTASYDILDQNSITVTGDIELKQKAIDNGWSGNGTLSNPYIINSDNFDNLYLEEIDSYVRVEENYITQGSITLKEVKNIEVKNNILNDSHLLVENSEEITIFNNTIIKYPIIKLTSTTKITITNNFLSTGEGGPATPENSTILVISNSTDLTINNNKFSLWTFGTKTRVQFAPMSIKNVNSATLNGNIINTDVSAVNNRLSEIRFEKIDSLSFRSNNIMNSRHYLTEVKNLQYWENLVNNSENFSEEYRFELYHCSKAEIKENLFFKTWLYLSGENLDVQHNTFENIAETAIFIAHNENFILKDNTFVNVWRESDLANQEGLTDIILLAFVGIVVLSIPYFFFKRRK